MPRTWNDTACLDNAGADGVVTGREQPASQQLAELVPPRAPAGGSVWLGLGVVLALFFWYGLRQRPQELFGYFHDDSLYFSSAQAIAQGRGYLAPHLPGAPPQTKYPELYPWLLSWIWRWRPSFPANATSAVALSGLFACWFLAASFLMIRRLAGFSDGIALAAVALCAFQPLFVMWGFSVMSEVPFMAFAMTAMLLADRALGRDAPAGMAIAAGIMAGLSVMARSIGVAVLAGIVAAFILRRAGRRAVWAVVPAFPLLLFNALWSHATPAVVLSSVGGSPGWRQTWLYYTSYWQFWKLSVPSWTVFRAMLGENLQTWAEMPATFCLFPPLGGEGFYPGILLCITLTSGILMGMIRQARVRGWRPVHFVFVCYSAVTLLWNFPLAGRFLLVFLPLFYAGLFTEARHLYAMLAAGIKGGRPAGERILALLLILASAGIAAWSARQYAGGLRGFIAERHAARTALAPEKQELYEWIRSHTSPSARFLSYEDANLYLYTGRQAIRPVVFTTDVSYVRDEKLLEMQLNYVADVARQSGAAYWVNAADDWLSQDARSAIFQRFDELQSVLPMAFHSSRWNVQVFDLACVQDPERNGCPQAARVFFSGTYFSGD